MILDATTWDWVKAVLGEDWLWREGVGGKGYVATERKRAVAHAAGTPVLVLARYIAKAPPGTVVTCRDGNALNLARGNLDLWDRGEFLAQFREARDAT